MQWANLIYYAKYTWYANKIISVDLLQRIKIDPRKQTFPNYYWHAFLESNFFKWAIGLRRKCAWHPSIILVKRQHKQFQGAAPPFPQICSHPKDLARTAYITCKRRRELTTHSSARLSLMYVLPSAYKLQGASLIWCTLCFGQGGRIWS